MGLSYGIFIGCLSVSVAEVFNVLPILCRRAKLAKDIPWLLLVLGAGKTAAVLVYYFLPGFLMLE
jgi:stage V sporulation protein AB